jgi:hypothetical protein
MFEQQFVTFEDTSDLPNLAGSSVLVDEADFLGIQIAANNVVGDFARVFLDDQHGQVKLLTSGDPAIPCDVAIIIGSIEKNRIIRRLGTEGKLDTDCIRGKWESFTTSIVQNPFQGCRIALIIAGSDKRGAIFGAYTLSEQIGVSPYDVSTRDDSIITELTLVMVQLVLVGRRAP